MKLCSKCGEIKSSELFNKDKAKKSGLSTYCKPCSSAVSSKYYTENSGRIRQRVTAYTHSHQRSEYKSILHRLKNLVTKANGRKWKVEITFEYLVDKWDSQNGLCAYSGLPLTYEANQPNTVSLDRIDSKLGYLKGNVQLVCAMVNRMKQEFSQDLFLDMCRKITENTKAKTTSEHDPRLDNDYIVNTEPLTLNSVSTIPN